MNTSLPSLLEVPLFSNQCAGIVLVASFCCKNMMLHKVNSKSLSCLKLFFYKEFPRTTFPVYREEVNI